MSTPASPKVVVWRGQEPQKIRQNYCPASEVCIFNLSLLLPVRIYKLSAAILATGRADQAPPCDQPPPPGMPPRRQATASVSASTPGTGTASVSAATPDGASGTASRPPLRRRPAAAPARSRSPRGFRLATPSCPRTGETREEREARLLASLPAVMEQLCQILDRERVAFKEGFLNILASHQVALERANAAAHIVRDDMLAIIAMRRESSVTGSGSVA